MTAPRSPTGGPAARSRGADLLVEETVKGVKTFLTVTSPIAPSAGKLRAVYRVHVTEPKDRRGSISEMTGQLLEAFAKALHEPFIEDFIKASAATTDSKARIENLASLTRLLQWKGPGKQLPRADAHVEFQALGVWNAPAWLEPAGQLGPLPRLLILLKVLCSHAGSDEELLALIAQALGEGTRKEEASKVLTRIKQLLRKDRNKRGASGYSSADSTSSAMLAAFNKLPSREHLPVLHFSDLVDVNLGAATEGRTALSAFEAWLRVGLAPPKDALEWERKRSTPHPEIDSNVIARYAAALVTEITKPKWAFTLMQWPCGIQPDMGIAIASSCVDAIRRSEPGWRVIWLCASRPSQPFFRVSELEFLRPLAHAFAVTLPQEGKEGSAVDLRAILDVLRLGLSRYKCLIVVEGLRNAAGRIGPLLDFLSGTSTFEEFVRGLATPPITDACNAPDTGYAVSRFLLLPAQTMRGVFDLSLPIGSTPALISATSEVVTASARLMPEASRITGFTLNNLINSETFLDKARTQDPSVLVHTLVTELAKNHPETLIVLCLIASVPDGTLLGTMRRVIRRWRLLIEKIVKGDLARDVGDLLDVVGDRIAELSTRINDFRHAKRQKGVGTEEWLSGSAIYEQVGKLLCLELQEVHEHLGVRQLRWEVEEDIDGAGVGADPYDDETTWGRFKPRLAIRSPSVRDLLIETICRNRSLSTDALHTYLLSRLGWRLMQFALAGECLRQGTALLRNTDPTGSIKLESRRRLIQAQYHILAAGNLSGVNFGDVRGEELDIQELLYPADDYRRRSYIYSVLYKQLIEHDDWLITRAWGRSELRVGLLLQALYPGWHPRSTQTARPKTAMEYAALDRSDDAIRALDQLVVAAERKRDEASAQTQAHELRLQRAFFRNLLHAASDAEDHELAHRCLLIIKQISANAPERSSVSSRRSIVASPRVPAGNIATSKLEFDALDGRSDDRAAAAKDVCVRALEHAGIDERWISEVKRIGKKLAVEIDSRPDPIMVLGVLKELRDGWLHVPTLQNGGDIGFVADMVARWADFLSNQADQIEDKRLDVYSRVRISSQAIEDHRQVTQIKDEIEAFLVAWTAFWLTNALRAEVGMQLENHGRRWGKVSARTYRTGIRTTLKLARLLAVRQALHGRTSEANHEPSPAVRWFMEYALSRADILARDVYLYERERIQSLLIQASIARTSANIDRDLNGHLIGHPRMIRALRDAMEYVASAERRIVDLGSPQPVSRRWIVERISVLGLWLQLLATAWDRERKGVTYDRYVIVHAKPVASKATSFHAPDSTVQDKGLEKEIAHTAAALVHDMNVLERLAYGSHFWVSLHKRSILRYEVLRSRFQFSDFNWPIPQRILPNPENPVDLPKI